METTESPTKMEVDTNGTGETKEAEAEKPAVAVATTTEAKAETKEISSAIDSSTPAPSEEEVAPPVETPSDAIEKTDRESDHNAIYGSLQAISVDKNGVEIPTPQGSPPKAAPVSGDDSTPTSEKAQPENKPESLPKTTIADNATEPAATAAAAPVVPSSAVKPTATATKPKPSPTASVTSKTKITSATKVAKSSSTKVSSKTSMAKSATSTKSLKKGARKKRKTAGIEEAEEKGGTLPKAKKAKRKKDEAVKANGKADKAKKIRKQNKKASGGSGNSGAHPYADLHALPGLSAAQMAVQEQMRKALEEDQYSANGSIIDTDSDDDENQYMYKGQSIRLDRAHLLQAAKKCGWFFGDMSSAGLLLKAGKDGDKFDDNNEEEGILNEDGSTNNALSVSKKKSFKNKKKGRNQYTNRNNNSTTIANDSSSSFRIVDKPKNEKSVEAGKPKNMTFIDKGADMERDEGSIFGQTTGASNSTWVECDKCKKWRRLRGVVDHSKLPKKWYCSMNRNDPERARCSAPEEEYDAPHTPESAADARTRKHLRVWVRRLQCNEQYESRLPTQTRGKKRSVACTSKDPHEWIRCCNPSCGKWRALLRVMDAKQNVIDRTLNKEWYCVMNTWDEKMASCAAPQENLPAVGCPPWVLQDEN